MNQQRGGRKSGRPYFLGSGWKIDLIIAFKKTARASQPVEREDPERRPATSRIRA
jgi:hypothetical protein